MDLSRACRVRTHDDGLNAWEMARMAPTPALQGVVTAYADYAERTGGFTTRRELPHSEGVLIVNLGPPIAITGGDGGVISLGAGEAFAGGPHLRAALSRSTGAQAGVHVFLPLETLRRLIGAPMSDLVDRVAPLDALLGAEARALGARLCEAPDREARARVLDVALARRLERSASLDSRLTYALTALRARPDQDIAEIAADIGWSCKHLRTRVKDAVGVGPRSYRRLVRFEGLTRGIARAGGAPNWSALALDAGYFDQAHMIREFREFSGLTPGSYLARSLPGGGGLLEA